MCYVYTESQCEHHGPFYGAATEAKSCAEHPQNKDPKNKSLWCTKTSSIHVICQICFNGEIKRDLNRESSFASPRKRVKKRSEREDKDPNKYRRHPTSSWNPDASSPTSGAAPESAGLKPGITSPTQKRTSNVTAITSLLNPVPTQEQTPAPTQRNVTGIPSLLNPEELTREAAGATGYGATGYGPTTATGYDYYNLHKPPQTGYVTTGLESTARDYGGYNSTPPYASTDLAGNGKSPNQKAATTQPKQHPENIKHSSAGDAALPAASQHLPLSGAGRRGDGDPSVLKCSHAIQPQVSGYAQTGLGPTGPGNYYRSAETYSGHLNPPHTGQKKILPMEPNKPKGHDKEHEINQDPVIIREPDSFGGYRDGNPYCFECARYYNSIIYLRRHIDTFHDKRHRCNVWAEECLADYPTREELNEHKLEAHKRIACNSCKSNIREEEYDAHVRVNHGGNFGNKIEIKNKDNHGTARYFLLQGCVGGTRKKNGNRKYWCSSCGALVASRDELILHMKKQHSPRRWACELSDGRHRRCFWDFPSERELEKHQGELHNPETLNLGIREVNPETKEPLGENEVRAHTNERGR